MLREKKTTTLSYAQTRTNTNGQGIVRTCKREKQKVRDGDRLSEKQRHARKIYIWDAQYQ